MTRTLDFNCDLGEGCDDAAVMPWISSASIACGGHAGDATTMRDTVALCLRHGVAIGAHPSHVDRDHFGRRALDIRPAQAHALVLDQLRTLQAVVDAAAATLRHVKPHGALYNQAAAEPALARAIAAAVREHDPALILYGLSGSALTTAGTEAGLQVAHEVFAERRYEADGRLTPRGTPGASIEDTPTAIAQVRALLQGRATARTGEPLALRADTLCLHGDRDDAADFAQALRTALDATGCRIAAPARVSA